MAGPAAADKPRRELNSGDPGGRFPSCGAEIRARGPEKATLNQRVVGSSPTRLTHTDFVVIAGKLRISLLSRTAGVRVFSTNQRCLRRLVNQVVGFSAPQRAILPTSPALTRNQRGRGGVRARMPHPRPPRTVSVS